VEGQHRQLEGFQSAFAEASEIAEQVTKDSFAPHAAYLEDALRFGAPYTAPQHTAPHHPQDDIRGGSQIGLFRNFSL